MLQHDYGEATPSFDIEDARSPDAARTRVLVVDDDPLVRSLLTSTLVEQDYDAAAAATPDEAFDLLHLDSFDLVIADLCLPGVSGLDLLSQIRAAYPDLPVVLITGFADPTIARKAMSAGASDFITKPFRPHDLPIIIERNLVRHQLYQRRSLAHRHQLQISYEAVLDALLTALDTRDTETEGHSERVTGYTMLLADALRLPADELYHIERGALLHDIGKIGVSDAILHKPGPLTPEQWAEMKRHPEIGYRMCARIDFLGGAAQIVLQHHERWDGLGYPNGIKQDRIHIGARIFAVVDAFDAMTTDRPYRAALSYADARAEIAQQAGAQFDPEVVECFLSIPERRWIRLREQLSP